MADFFLVLLVVFSIILVVAIVFLWRQNELLRLQLEQILFAKNSQSVKYGKLTEQFIPFTEKFPFSSSAFRFLGTPIDGVAFEGDKIVFCEFKTASSQLSPLQKNIKKLVEEKKVEWFEFKLR